MTPRFRMVAGPNGSGKTTLAAKLAAKRAADTKKVLAANAEAEARYNC